MLEANAQARIVLTTESTLDEANKLGRTLVEERLVACATLLPVVQSIYYWKDHIHSAPETMILLKTSSEKLEALRLLSEHILPGRWAESRFPTEKEIKATLVLRLPIEEFSAKVRVGPPIDDEEDYSFPTWAGVVPLEMVAGEPIDDARMSAGVDVPEYARAYTRKR